MHCEGRDSEACVGPGGVRVTQGSGVKAQLWQMAQAASEALVEGLFSVLVTLGAVPIIRCPKVRKAPRPPLIPGGG